MKPITPEEVLSKIISGLLRERRFSVESSEGSDGKYILKITTVSRNQGRILGGGAATLKSIKSLMVAIDPEIEVILEDPDETTPINPVATSCAMDALIPWLVLVFGGAANAAQENNKILIEGGDSLKKSIQNDATNVFFSIGRAQSRYAEIIWD